MEEKVSQVRANIVAVAPPVVAREGEPDLVFTAVFTVANRITRKKTVCFASRDHH